MECTCRPRLPRLKFPRISSRIVAIRMEGFIPIILFTGTVLLSFFPLVQAASSTNHNTLAAVTAVADRIKPSLHSSNLNVLQQILPATVSAKSQMRLLIVVLGTKIYLVTLVHRFEVFQNVVTQTLCSKICSTTRKVGWIPDNKRQTSCPLLQVP